MGFGKKEGILLLFFIILIIPLASRQITAAASYDYINLEVSSTTHNDYGLAYPMTYKFSIPSGSSDLKAYKRYSDTQEWEQIIENTSDHFFNGIEAVRFDYTNNKAYISVAFNDTSDEIHLNVTDALDQMVNITYQGIPDYYDNRNATVVVTGDDWSGQEDNDANFTIACDVFRTASIWFTVGIITNYGSTPPIWANIQAEIDEGYVEPASHSRTHCAEASCDYDSEIGGSKDDIIGNLSLPALNKKGETKYIYAWIEPAGYSDETVRSKLGEYKYLADRSIVSNENIFATWNSTDGLFNQIGYSYDLISYNNLIDANNKFDSVVNLSGIYHLFLHPWSFNWTEESWERQHIDYIKEKKNLWYAGFGHLYLYHYLDNQNKVNVTIIGKFPLDETTPNLDSWDLDLNAGTMTLYFNEPMNYFEVDNDETKFTIQDAETAATSYVLTDSTSSWTDPATLSITFSVTDVNTLELNSELANSSDNSWLTIAAGSGLTDADGNPLATIGDGNGIQVTNYTAYTGAPAVENSICWHLRFCEYLNITAALEAENGTEVIIYFLDNNTVYTMDKTTYFENMTFIINNENITIDFNGSKLNLTERQDIIKITDNSNDITIRNGYFISYENGVNISSSDTTLLNNTFHSQKYHPIFLNNIDNINLINNTFNETGNQTTGFFANKIGLKYNGPTTAYKISYDNVLFSNAIGSTAQKVSVNGTRITVLSGTQNAALFLINDTGNYFGYGVGTNVTAWLDGTTALNCTSITTALKNAGKSSNCVYENKSGAMYNQGATGNYVYNITDTNVETYQGTPNLDYNGYFFQTGFPIDLQGARNINITGNKFYNTNTNMTAINNYPTSSNAILWYNNFYGSGINTTTSNMTGCYNNIGNFYDYRVPYTQMAGGECGLVNITSPSSSATQGAVTIQWTPQDSSSKVTYILETILNGVRSTLTTTTSTSYSWSVATLGNYTINIIPQVNPNGTNRNSTVLINAPEEPDETVSNMPSGGGESRDIPPIVGTLLEKAECFRINITKFNLSLIQDESKTEILEIENPLQNDLIIKIIPKGDLADIIKPSENYFILKSGKTKIINLEIMGKEPGTYKGIINIVCDKCQKMIDMTINVEAKQTSEVKEQIEKSTLMDKIRQFFIWIGKIIEIIVNWFKELF